LVNKHYLHQAMIFGGYGQVEAMADPKVLPSYKVRLQSPFDPFSPLNTSELHKAVIMPYGKKVAYGGRDSYSPIPRNKGA